MRSDGEGSGRGGAVALRGGVVLRLADQSQRLGVNGEAGGLYDAGRLCESVSGFGNAMCRGLGAGFRRAVTLPKLPCFHGSGMFLLVWPQVRGRDLTTKWRKENLLVVS